MIFSEFDDQDVNIKEWVAKRRKGSAIYYAYRYYKSKYHWKSLGTTNELVAYVLVARMNEEETRPQKEDYTVLDLMHYYYRFKLDKVASPTQLRFCLRVLSNFFGALKPEEVTEDMWRRYMEARGVSANTLRNERIWLLAVLNMGYRRGLMKRPPMISRVPPQTPSGSYLTRDEAARLIKACAFRHSKLLYTIMIYTGCRNGAALSLTWDRVDFERNLIDFRLPGVVHRLKRRAVVPMGPKLLKAMTEAYEYRDCDHVISWGGKPIANSKNGFTNARDRAGLRKDITSHSLRRSAATWLAQGGVPISEASALLACSMQTLQKIYVKYDADHLRMAADVLEGNVDRWEGNVTVAHRQEHASAPYLSSRYTE